MPDLSTNTTHDRFFAGALSLRQPRSGHRSGTDAVLLAASLPLEARRIADLGAGTGIVGLRAAQLNPQARVTLIERDAELVQLAAANIAENALTGAVEPLVADVFRLGGRPELREAFDCLLTNPPFHAAARVRPSPKSGRAAAHVFGGDAPAAETLDGWLRGAATLLAPKGQVVMVHVAAALPEVLKAMATRFGDIRLRFVHADAAQPAIRLLLRGRKGSRAPLSILPPLVLHAPDGGFSPAVEALHRGETRLDWEK